MLLHEHPGEDGEDRDQEDEGDPDPLLESEPPGIIQLA